MRGFLFAPLGRRTCEKRGREATGGAEGWEALLVDLDDDGQDEISAYREATRENFPVG
jgi:hypothetical protein